MATDRTRWARVLLVFAGLAALGLAWSPQDQPQQDPRTMSRPGFGTADSNGSMIAVTAVDVTGASLLYVIDTDTRRLSVYSASGGTKSTAGVQWLGARNIDLDLQVDGYNDKSEHSFQELKGRFDTISQED